MNKAFPREIKRRLLTTLPVSIPMIETLIWAVGVGLLLIFCLLAYVLCAEINKQKRPSRFHKTKQQHTAVQQEVINQGGYLGGGIGMLFSVLFRVYGFSNALLWAGLILTTLALMVWVLSQLKQPESKNRASEPAPTSHQPEHGDVLRRQLIRLVGGDRELAQRLAALEGGDWQAAIDKLIRDRR